MVPFGAPVQQTPLVPIGRTEVGDIVEADFALLNRLVEHLGVIHLHVLHVGVVAGFLIRTALHNVAGH